MTTRRPTDGGKTGKDERKVKPEDFRLSRSSSADTCTRICARSRVRTSRRRSFRADASHRGGARRRRGARSTPGGDRALDRDQIRRFLKALGAAWLPRAGRISRRSGRRAESGFRGVVGYPLPASRCIPRFSDWSATSPHRLAMGADARGRGAKDVSPHRSRPGSADGGGVAVASGGACDEPDTGPGVRQRWGRRETTT